MTRARRVGPPAVAAAAVLLVLLPPAHAVGILGAPEEAEAIAGTLVALDWRLRLGDASRIAVHAPEAPAGAVVALAPPGQEPGSWAPLVDGTAVLDAASVATAWRGVPRVADLHVRVRAGAGAGLLALPVDVVDERGAGARVVARLHVLAVPVDVVVAPGGDARVRAGFPGAPERVTSAEGPWMPDGDGWWMRAPARGGNLTVVAEYADGARVGARIDLPVPREDDPPAGAAVVLATPRGEGTGTLAAWGLLVGGLALLGAGGRWIAGRHAGRGDGDRSPE